VVDRGSFPVRWMVLFPVHQNQFEPVQRLFVSGTHKTVMAHLFKARWQNVLQEAPHSPREIFFILKKLNTTLIFISRGKFKHSQSHTAPLFGLRVLVTKSHAVIFQFH